MEASLFATAVLTILVFVLKNSQTKTYAPVRIKVRDEKRPR